MASFSLLKLMAYKIAKGSVSQTVIPPEEEEPKVDHSTRPSYVHSVPVNNVVDMFPHQKAKYLEKDQVIIVKGDEIIPNMLCLKDRVIRRVRPNEIGTVESLYWQKDSNNEDFLKHVYVRFGLRTAFPYDPQELLKVKTH